MYAPPERTKKRVLGFFGKTENPGKVHEPGRIGIRELYTPPPPVFVGHAGSLPFLIGARAASSPGPPNQTLDLPATVRTHELRVHRGRLLRHAPRGESLQYRLSAPFPQGATLGVIPQEVA